MNFAVGAITNSLFVGGGSSDFFLQVVRVKRIVTKKVNDIRMENTFFVFITLCLGELFGYILNYLLQ